MNIKYLWYRLRWKLAPWILPRFPIHLDVEITSRCNLICIMCPQSDKPKRFPVGDMDFKMLRSILKQGAGKAPSVKFNWRGEPTLYKALPQAIDLAKQLGYVDVTINTNGNYPVELNERLKNLTTCIFSLDSINPEVYKKIRPGGDLSLVLNNMERLRRINPEMRIAAQMRAQELNKQEVSHIKKLMIRLGFELRVAHAVKRNSGDDYVLGDLKAQTRKNCWMPWRRLLVDFEGNIYPCCCDWYGKYPVGNIKVFTLSSIWNHSALYTIRNALKSGIAFSRPPCEGCFSRESHEINK